MRTVAVLFLLLFIPVGAFAQKADPKRKNDQFVQGDTVKALLAKNSNDSSQKQIPANPATSASPVFASDSGEIPQGVIYVRKPDIIPYVKVEYKYYLSHVSMVKIDRPVDNGITTDVQTDNVPVFDSNMYSQKLERVYPRKNEQLFSKRFLENMQYRYNVSDTPRVDTMVMGMWINTRGKVQRVLDDPDYTLKMPDEMVKELIREGQTISDWGDPGGYKEKKKLFRKQATVLESYYVEVFIIVSSHPLTQEQTITRYAPFDNPLNSPPLDEQQKKSMEKNGVISPENKGGH